MSDRRRHRRFTLQLEAEIFMGESQEPIIGNLMEISVGGAFVTAPIEPDAGSSVFIRFVYQDEHKCEATGHVVRTLPFGRANGIAIRFGITNPPLQALARTLAQMPELLQADVLSAISDVHLRIE